MSYACDPRTSWYGVQWWRPCWYAIACHSTSEAEHTTTSPCARWERGKLSCQQECQRAGHRRTAAHDMLHNTGGTKILERLASSVPPISVCCYIPVCWIINTDRLVQFRRELGSELTYRQVCMIRKSGTRSGSCVTWQTYPSSSLFAMMITTGPVRKQQLAAVGNTKAT